MMAKAGTRWSTLMGVLMVLGVMLLMAQPTQPSAAQGPQHTPTMRSPIDDRFATVSALANGQVPLTGQLVYVSSKTGHYELYTLDLAGGESKQITDDGISKWWPEWSHDGTQIAFVKEVPTEKHYTIFIMDADGSNERRVTQSGLNIFCVDWSPDDKQLVLCGGVGPYENVALDIYTINVDGTGLTKLTNDPSRDYEPQWSPDGQFITFSSDRNAPSGFGGAYGQVYVMRADGSEVRQLTNSETSSFGPSWSRDGTMLAYVGDCPGASIGTLCVMKADGSDKRAVAESQYDSAPRWSPDGKHIIVSRMDRNGNLESAELHVLSVDGDEDRQLTNNQWMDYLPNWK